MDTTVIYAEIYVVGCTIYIYIYVVCVCPYRVAVRDVVEAAVTGEAEGAPPPRPSSVWTWPRGPPSVKVGDL